MRITFVVLTRSLVLILIAFWLLGVNARQREWMAWLVLGSGVIDLLLIRWLRAQPLSTSSPRSLVAAYREKMFIGIGLAEIPALVGLTTRLLAAPMWVAVVGVGVAGLGLALVAPSARDIARRQEQIVAQGSGMSLLETLTNPFDEGTPGSGLAAPE